MLVVACRQTWETFVWRGLKWIADGQLLAVVEDRVGNRSRFMLRRWDSRDWDYSLYLTEWNGVWEEASLVGDPTTMTVDVNSSKLLLSGPARVWFSISESVDITTLGTHALPLDGVWKMSPTDSQFLIHSSLISDGPLAFIEASFSFTKSTTQVSVRGFAYEGFPALNWDEPFFLYGSNGETLFLKRNDSIFLEEYKIIRPTRRKNDPVRFFHEDLNEIPIEPEGILRFVKNYALTRGDVARSWISADWKMLVLMFWNVSKNLISSIGIFNLENPHDVAPLQGLGDLGEIVNIGIHPSNRYLGIVRKDSSLVEIFDLESQSILRQFDWQCGPLNCIEFSQDGTMIAAIAGGDKVIVWDVDF